MRELYGKERARGGGRGAGDGYRVPGTRYPHRTRPRDCIIASVAGPKPLIPEIVEPEESLPSDLRALTQFARLMDEAIAIPGTKRRMGLDPLLGLIPGIGDAIAALLSTWIVVGALRWRVPLWRVTRMVANILIDLAFGSVPVVGDIFDFFFE